MKIMKYGYNIPVFFEDCSNPITLKYVNDKIVEDYSVENIEVLKYDGSLLKSAKVNIEDINATINFDLNIVSTNNEIHKIPLSIKIPLEDKENSIYDGDYEQNKKVNLKF